MLSLLSTVNTDCNAPGHTADLYILTKGQTNDYIKQLFSPGASHLLHLEQSYSHLCIKYTDKN